MIKRIQRTGLWPAGLTLLANGILLVWMLWGPAGQAVYPGLDMLMAGVLLLVACQSFASFMALRREQHSLQWMPLLITLGLIFTFLGQIMGVYYDLTQGIPPYPSLADFFYLSAYPLYMWGILLFPVSRLSPVGRARRATDGLLMVLVLATLSWYFVLGPTIQQASGPLAGLLTGVAYPCADLLLLFSVVVLYTKGSLIRRDLLPPLILLASGLLCLTLTDSFDGFTRLNNIPNSRFEFLGWSTGYLLIGLALQLIRSRGRIERIEAPERTSWKRSLLPYALVAILIPLVIQIWATRQTDLVTNGTALGCLLVIIVLLLRQIFAIRIVHEANTRLEALSTTDALTGLPNHRALATLLDQELERARRFERSCCLLFLDIDHFKALNDGYGHAAGDLVLRDFAALIRKTINAHDTAGRWGGEEFVVLLPELSPEEGRHMAERIRETIATSSFDIGGGSHITCSIGLACFPTHGLSRDELTHAADQAMYAAKRLGRNQVRSYDDPVVTTLLTAEQQQDRDETALEGTVQALVKLASVRDETAHIHAEQVGRLLYKLAIAQGMSSAEAHMLTLAGQLHDIGKVSIPDTILHKREKLSPQEWEFIYAHPVVGAEVVSTIPALRPLAPVIRAHHERWDGTGYPDQLVGDEIPRGARILAVVNAYLSMLEPHPYRPRPLTPTEAVAELHTAAGTQLDPRIVRDLLTLLQREQAAA